MQQNEGEVNVVDQDEEDYMFVATCFTNMSSTNCSFIDRGVQWDVLPILARVLAHYNVMSCCAYLIIVISWASTAWVSGQGWQDTGEHSVPCLRKWPIVPPCRPINPSCQPIVLAHRANPLTHRQMI